MTTPLQEYIITEFQLKQLQDFASLDFVCQAIRSRPHTSTLAETTIGHRIKNQGVTIFASYSALKEHDTAIRKAEREKVLSFLDELISDRVSDARKREIVESLLREP